MTSAKSKFAAPSPPLRDSTALERLLAPLDQIVADSPSLVPNRGARFDVAGQEYELPRYIFIGPGGGDAPIRVGIFAGIHGDEPEGPRAVVQFVKLLEAKPELVTGYCLYLYPVCNPTGYEDHTRRSRSGKDLNREFWTNSVEPEVRLLQAELVSRSFQGIISLHTDETGKGFYGVVRGATFTRHLIEPALQAAEAFLPRDTRTQIYNFRAQRGVIRDAHEGALSAPPRVRPRPFEIVLKTAKAPPSYLKDYAFLSALETILVEYRKFIAYAQNL